MYYNSRQMSLRKITCYLLASPMMAPDRAVSLALTILMFVPFQALLLEQINDSITTLGKSLEL